MFNPSAFPTRTKSSRTMLFSPDGDQPVVLKCRICQLPCNTSKRPLSILIVRSKSTQSVKTPNQPLFSVCKTALDSLLGSIPNPLDIETNVCTGPLTGGVSICAGDSGGPLADPQGQKLIGIASWTANPCGRPGAPSVHVRVSSYTRWIRSSISV